MTRNEIFTAALVIFFLCFAFNAMIGLFSCGFGKVACEVIDVADYACDTLPIRYLGPDGKPRVANVPKSALVRTAEQYRLQSSDAGADR